MIRDKTPLIIEAGATRAMPLARLPFARKGEHGYDERWIQELISSHPEVIPILEIEPAFSPPLSVCMELPLPSGYVDNLFVTPLGNLIVVECKLWRNGEARREVVAQVIDYAKDIQRLSYEELEKAIRQAREEPSFRLYDFINQMNEEPEPPLTEAGFVDAVCRNLRRGRCLLLVVGDGITENVEAMTEFLQQQAGMHFALALVQLAVYGCASNGARLVVPSVPLRTQNIIRGIVHVNEGVVEVLPPSPEPSQKGPSTLSQEEILSALDSVRAGTASELMKFIEDQEDLGVQIDFKKTIIVRMVVDEKKAMPFVISADGSIDTGYTANKDLTRTFSEVLARAIPGARVSESDKSIWVARRKIDGTPLTIWDILGNQPGVRQSLEALNRSMTEQP